MSDIYIAVGANMSNPKQTLLQLPRRLDKIGVKVQAASSLWRNPAWPAGHGYPDYLNGVLSVSFDGTALELLSLLHKLEHDAGRVRLEKNAPRPLDLDIIDFRGQVKATARLTLPHPRMHSRAFVLLPLAEIAPQWQHSQTGLTIMELLARLPLADMDAMRFEAAIED